MTSRIEYLSCPIDGSRMPLIGTNRSAGRRLLRLFWCRYCELGYAVLGEREKDTHRPAHFTVDAKTGTLTVNGPEVVQDAVADFVAQKPDVIARLVYAG